MIRRWYLKYVPSASINKHFGDNLECGIIFMPKFHAVDCSEGWFLCDLMGVCQSNAYKLSEQAKSHDNYGSDGTREKSRQLGAILGLSSISGKLLTCSDDKTVAVSQWNYPSPLHTSPKREGVSILTGHTKAVNRVTAFKDINGNLKCWTASRDLSLKCVSQRESKIPCIWKYWFLWP